MKNIYVCGPTVYSEPHIGNMRPIIVFDLYIRALKALEQDVRLIHNITDIDDKIIKRAKEENTTEKVISEKYFAQYVSLLKTVNVNSVSEMPTVMANMDKIIDFINKLVFANKAYVVDGNVYFDVTSTEGYGKLSNRKLDEMIYEEGASKRHPADFALWKRTSEGITFDSPWGKGRPGWHTECVVFINKFLEGKPLDIHGGGIDLLFPHHENENIQYKALYGSEIASEWRHVGHLNYEGEKMSKSLGNLISTSEFINLYGQDTLRQIFLSTSYSAPIDLTKELIQAAKEQVDRYKKAFAKAQLISLNGQVQVEVAKNISTWNFAHANKDIAEIVKNFNKDNSNENASKVIGLFEMLGFTFTNIRITDEDKRMYYDWEKARKDGRYESADNLRKILAEKNLI